MKRRINAWRWTYLAEHPTEPLIKIGNSKYPFPRMRQLRTKPVGLFAIHYYSVSNGEMALHMKFKHLRIKGEWFKDCDELRLFILKSGAHANLWDYHLRFLTQAPFGKRVRQNYLKLENYLRAAAGKGQA